jgi:hypothetical protein
MTQRANDFIIWRAGTSVNWECTVQEIADETGVHKSTVQRACIRRSWKTLPTDIGSGLRSRPSVDRLMASPYMQGGGAT